ncbi:DUF4238 domain-containing protein [Algoriphagus boritolerans]|uniref:DUF4238 domain-containing protein n=1 Tax=Algoriphagus boritolerans DSM 17298 = JCM 18970 TaxID=1120964 RepID=A0A1H5Y4B6_9BACT|nr:DUF4238 domain-containing protein [Algoriphagus boritolerans]SEG18366.1 Protein of unknown function [Algoriphagus boritolerans DSM 17298 = JCM 18970]
MKEKSKVKKQHYVPRLYLKNFSINERIFSFDKTQNKTIATNIKDIATKNYFYDDQKLDKVTGEQTYEKALSEMEGIFDRYLKIFIQNLNSGYSGLSNIDLKSTISEFIVIQLFRTPSSNKSFEYLTEILNKEIHNWVGKDSKIKSLIPNIDFLEIFGESLQNLNARATLIFEKIWVIWHNETKLKFITSDNPVVGFTEPLKKGYEIYFPINPEYSISLYDKTKYSDFKELDGNIIKVGEESVLYYNDLIFKSAERNFYSINNDFEYLIKS